MLCPRCGNDLRIGERSGIEIDYCPGCRGIWLDSGELDKILERAQAWRHGADGPGHQRPSQEPERESWWERIIDIFD